ncbi:MAG: porin family protein [Bradyrhizobium sp.]|uniref:outer membrane protein n=1 Tax=Bradyrhizobium sp. TaxID=376 RepID=UPI001DFBB5D6|nr:outer membrane beta-barrel protein [Bradyrhizobium sp.]MBV9565324.1 porin family protein [Bradyrhizobium sp.]
MRRVLLSAVAVAAALLGTPVFAADMAMKAAPLAAPAYTDWSGFYVGGNVGAVGEHASGTSNFVDTAFAPASPFFANPQSNSLSPWGVIGGVQVGYNWQISPRFVLGVEGDFDWTSSSYSFCRQTDIRFTGCLDAPPNIDGVASVSGGTDWIATARGRAGVTFNQFLLYATGGAAWGAVKSTESLTCLTDGCGATSTLRLAASSSNTQIKSGWTAGVGLEGMIWRNWSVKGEWLYVDLGNATDTLVTTGNRGGTESVVWSRSEHYNIFRVGLNYHFGGPAAAHY